MSGQPHRWLHRFTDRPGARVSLVCLPHAGGTADFYRDWAPRLPPHIELFAVQYPGRRERISEPPITDMGRLADAIGAVLTRLDRPYALFGHSMGAAIAYEAVLRTPSDPVRLFVSGREAPRRSRPGQVHRRGDEGLLAELKRLGGTPAELLDDSELRALVLPSVRADYRLIETYRPTVAEPLSCPVTAFVGESDPDAPIAEVAEWAETTDAGFELRLFLGDHFYLKAPGTDVVAEVVRRLGFWPSTP